MPKPEASPRTVPPLRARGPLVAAATPHGFVASLDRALASAPEVCAYRP